MDVNGPVPMGVSAVGGALKDDELVNKVLEKMYEGNEDDTEHVNAVGVQCQRCGGRGHIQRDCATPAPSKGGGKGMSKGGWQASGAKRGKGGGTGGAGWTVSRTKGEVKEKAAICNKWSPGALL